MFGIGAQELILILVVALLVFGPKRLPDLARSLGRGLAEFRRASSDLRQSIQLDAPPEDSVPPEPVKERVPEGANSDPDASTPPKPNSDRKTSEPSGE